MGVKKLSFNVIAGLFSFIILFACNSPKTEKAGQAWQIYLNEIGTYSSVRVAHLNKDKVLDIVLGAGGRENQFSDTAVVALDGKTGELLWKVSGANQFIGSAIFQDITNDSVPDVFIGGRWSELAAINGASGKVIWRFFPQRPQPNPADSGWFNFTTPQFIPDQDQDGLQDLIIANGGNPLVPPHDPKRPAGRLLVLSSKNGKILANVQVPDGKETYMSVVCGEAEPSGDIPVLFGTGGETIGGHLFRTTLKDIMKEDISQAKILATSNKKGFIGPPVLVDITQDGIKDIVINTVDGRMLALNGTNDSVLWQVTIPNAEAYTTPAIGYFNNDAIPDFFTNFGLGIFPNLLQSVLFMVDGKTGEIQYQVKVQNAQYACPVVADLNNDGIDDAIVNKNEVRWQNFQNNFYSYLLVFDFKNNNQYIIGDTLAGNNTASTPWVGDLDQDKYLDIVYSAVKYNELEPNPEIPGGLFVARYQTGRKVNKPVTWGAYLGSDYTGKLKNN